MEGRRRAGGRDPAVEGRGGIDEDGAEGKGVTLLVTGLALEMGIDNLGLSLLSFLVLPLASLSLSFSFFPSLSPPFSPLFLSLSLPVSFPVLLLLLLVPLSFELLFLLAEFAALSLARFCTADF